MQRPNARRRFRVPVRVAGVDSVGCACTCCCGRCAYRKVAAAEQRLSDLHALHRSDRLAAAAALAAAAGAEAGEAGVGGGAGVGVGGGGGGGGAGSGGSYGESSAAASASNGGAGAAAAGAVAGGGASILVATLQREMSTLEDECAAARRTTSGALADSKAAKDAEARAAAKVM